MKIVVGTTNPIKIEAVRRAFFAVWPQNECEVVGVKIESGVSDQPLSIEETIQGARNRAERALNATEADYGVGLEGGIYEIDNHLFVGGWVVIKNKFGQEGIGGSSSVWLSPVIGELVKQGNELGTACDKYFNRQNLKQAEGYIGVVTNNLLNRNNKFQEATISALARFLHPELF